MSIELTIVQVAVTAIPAALAVGAMFVGSKQMREFHRRTGDESLISHIAAFSAFNEESKKPDACMPEKVHEPA